MPSSSAHLPARLSPASPHPFTPLTHTHTHTTTPTPTPPPLQVMASEEEYQRMYGSYFVFAVVRNPWARAVSSYRMLSRYLRHGCKELVGGWNRVCTDANLLPLVHNQHPLCTISK